MGALRRELLRRERSEGGERGEHHATSGSADGRAREAALIETQGARACRDTCAQRGDVGVS